MRKFLDDAAGPCVIATFCCAFVICPIPTIGLVALLLNSAKKSASQSDVPPDSNDSSSNSGIFEKLEEEPKSKKEKELEDQTEEIAAMQANQ